MNGSSSNDSNPRTWVNDLVDAFLANVMRKGAASPTLSDTPPDITVREAIQSDVMGDWVHINVPFFGVALSIATNLVTYMLYAATMREELWPTVDRFRFHGIAWVDTLNAMGVEINFALIVIYITITLVGESFTVKYLLRLSRYLSAKRLIKKHPQAATDNANNLLVDLETWLIENIPWAVATGVVTSIDLVASAVDMSKASLPPFKLVMIVMAAFLVFSGEAVFTFQKDARKGEAESGRDLLSSIQASRRRHR